MTARSFAFTVTVLLLAGRASAQTTSPTNGWEDRAFPFVIGAYNVAGAADVAGTTFLIGQGSGREALVAPFGDHLVLFAASKLSLLALANYELTQKVRPEKPKVAFWMSVVLTSIEVTVTAHNARLAR